MGILSLFGFGNKSENTKEFISRKAIIIDVRTSTEFHSGHINNSINIPLDELSSKIEELKKRNLPVITCCRSGMRSAQAAALLKQNGIDTLNGGGWQNLQSKL